MAIFAIMVGCRAGDQLEPLRHEISHVKGRPHLPPLKIDLTVTPIAADQELITQESTQVTYWERSVSVEGTYEEKPITSLGYVELKGYAGPLGGKI